MHSTTNPNSMTISERALEAVGLIATGVLRVKRKQMENICQRSEKGLDLSADSSVHSMKPSARGENR